MRHSLAAYTIFMAAREWTDVAIYAASADIPNICPMCGQRIDTPCRQRCEPTHPASVPAQRRVSDLTNANE